MLDRILLDRPAVARKLGLTVERFYIKYAELRADGFPLPALGSGRGARWDPRAIDAWLDAKIPAAVNSNVLPLTVADTAQPTSADAILDQRAAQLARG